MGMIKSLLFMFPFLCTLRGGREESVQAMLNALPNKTSLAVTSA